MERYSCLWEMKKHWLVEENASTHGSKPGAQCVFSHPCVVNSFVHNFANFVQNLALNSVSKRLEMQG